MRRFDPAGVLLGEVALSGAAADSKFTIASGAGGDAWVSGGTRDGGPAGFGVWHVSEGGLTLISSTSVYGEFDMDAGGIAVGAESRVWVSAAQVIDSTGSVRFALWRYEPDGSLSDGFPKYQRRDGGVLDGGLSIAVDSAGDVWSAGVSSNPANTAYDLALWRFNSAGVLSPGFPVYRGSAYASLNDIDAGLVIAAGQKVWVAASQKFPGCAAQQHALFRFDLNGAVELQRYWHNTAETASSGRSIALDSEGNPWVLGRSTGTAAVWAYDRFGALEQGYPRADPALASSGLALDAGGVPWVVYGSTPGAFVGVQAVDGAAGLPSCAQPAAGTISGSVIVAGGAPAGSTVTIIASSDGFSDVLYTETVISTGGESIPFAIGLATPVDYLIGAFLGDNPKAIELSTPIGFYRDFASISLDQGAAASGINITIALDAVPPAASVAFPAAGSTIAALPVVEGAASDANGLNQDLNLAIQDSDANLWWDSSQSGWITSASPVYRNANADFTGAAPNALEWSARISGVDSGNFGRLDERLVNGHHYRVLARVADFVGNESEPAATTFVWDGPTGNVGPQAPGNVAGQALGISSAAWTWDVSAGATAYFLARSEFATPFASVLVSSYTEEGFLPSERRFLCVAAVNLLAAGRYNCGGVVDADPASPGPVAAVSVGTESVTWSWSDGGNDGRAYYTLNLSTDSFATIVSTPTPVGGFLTATSLFTPGLTPDTDYKARVRAYNASAKLSGFTVSATTRTNASGPDAPSGLAAVVDRLAASVALSWSPPVPAPASYRVYRGTDSASLTLLAEPAAASYLDQPGASAFYYYAVSAVGTLGAAGPRSSPVSVRFDATRPQLSLIQPADGATLSRPYTVMATASDDFTSASVRFDIDGNARVTTTVSHQYLWDVRAESDGLHSVRVVAKDDDGNETTIVHSVTVAYSTPAAPTIHTPSDNYSTTATTLTIQGFAPPLTSVRVLAGATEIDIAAADVIGQWNLTDVAFPDRGDFLLTAVAFDAGRLVGRNDSDASAPLRVASFAQPPDAPGTVSAAVDHEAGRVELTWPASAGATPASEYRVERATDATGVYYVLGSTPTTTILDFPGVSGEYRYRVRAEHGSGLVSAFVSASAVLDFTPPAAITDLRITQFRSVGPEVDLAWTAVADDFSGAARQLFVRSLSGRFDADASTTTLGVAVSGSTVTYTVTVGAGTERFRVYTEDSANNRSAASNLAVYDPIPPQIVSVSLADFSVVSRPVNVSVAANDDVGVARAVFIVNGSTEADVSQSPYTFYWDIRDWTDGEAELVVDVYDAAGNKASVLLDETISYAPPAAPTIFTPSNGFGTEVAAIAVSGYSDPGVGIDLLVNNLDVATTTAQGGFWSFPELTLPAEGDIRLTAIAFESRGFSAPSAPVLGVYSATAPNPPEFVNAEAASAGRSLLSWQAPTGGKRPTFYRVYRSTDDALLTAGAAPTPSLRAANQIAAPQYSDTPAADDLYFYTVTSVDGAGKESAQSAVVYVLTDRVQPRAAVSFSAVPPFGVGDHPALLTLSEPLSDAPLFTFTPPGGQPQALPATPLTATLWRTTVTVTSAMNSGAGVIAFQGTDLSGNVGHAISSETVTLDTRGPVGVVTLSRPSPVSVGPLTFTVTLNEPSVSTPTLVFTAQEGAPLSVSLSQAGAGDNRTWSGGLTVDTLTGEGLAGLGDYSASDLLGNLGVTLTGSTTFLIDTLAPAPPRVVRANPLPGAVILLSWSAPLGERPTFYRVLRDGETLSASVPAAEDGSGTYSDSTTEGVHSYDVSSIDLAGNESEAEALNPPVTAKAVPPSPPAAVSAAISAGQVQVTWQSGSADTIGYRLYRATYPFTTVSGLAFRTASPPFLDSPTVNGAYHYAVTALDFATNESTMSAQAVVVWDRSAPTIVIAGFEDRGYFKTNVAPVFTAFDPQLDPNTLVGDLDGQPFVSGSTVSAEGVHVLSVTAATVGGHASFSSATFTLDKTPPSIDFGGIASGAQIVSTVPISAFVTVADLNPGATTVFLTNSLIGLTVPYANGDPIARNGDYALTASATDLAGNSSTATLSFRLQIGPIAPKSFAVLIQGSARLSWTAPEPGIAGYRVYRDGARISASLFTGTFFNDTGYTVGTHVYEVSAVDAAGVEGPRARAPVPAATLGLRDVVLTRGFFDALTVTLANGATDNSLVITNAISLTLRDASGATAADSTAPALAASANDTGLSQGVFAVPAALTTNCVVHVAAPLHTGSTSYAVTFAGDFPVTSREPAQPLLEVFPGTLVLGTPSPVQVRVYNRGSAPMDIVTALVANSTVAAVDDVTVKLLTSEGTLLASGGIAQNQHGAQSAFVEGRQIFFVRVPANGSFLLDPVRVVVPDAAAGTLSVAAFVSTPTYSMAFNSVFGTRGFSSSQAQATVSQVPYLATVFPGQPVYDQGAVVSLSGQALDIGDGSPVPNSPVEVHVVANGYDRHIATVTDAGGSYQAFFFPLSTESGAYSLFASHPDVVTHAVTSSFTIVGFNYEFTSFSATLAQNSSLPFGFKLTNTGAVPLEGLQLSTIALINGEGLVLSLDTGTLPSTLAAGEAATLDLTVSAAPTASNGTFELALAEAHGFTRSIPVTISVFPAEVIAKLTPSQFAVGMLGGESRSIPVTVQNIGFDTWRGVTVTAPALDWVTVVGPGVLGDIPPRGAAIFTLNLNPPPALANGTYDPTPLLQLTSMNTPPVGLNAAIAITSSRKGNADFSVINADKPRNVAGQGVPIPQAAATMVSLDVEALSFKATADLNGLATFSQIPSGKYSWHVDAQGFQTKSGNLTIESGLTQSVEAVLPTSVVSYEWKVTPTRIQDKYDIVLDLAFKTDVPAPAIVMEPALLNLQMVAGQTLLTQFTMTNKGMVTADDVKVEFKGDGAIAVEMPIDSIPRLEAGQTVTIPAKITLVHSSCNAGLISIFAGYLCAAGIKAACSFVGPKITAGDCGGAEFFSEPGASGGGGGTGGAVSGGYIDFTGTSPVMTCAAAPSGGPPEDSCGERCNTPANPPPNPPHVPPPPVPPLPPVKPPLDPRCPPTSDDASNGPDMSLGYASPGLDATPHYSSGKPEDGPWGFGWFSEMHLTVQLRGNGSLMSVDESGNQLIYTPLNNPPDGYTAFYAQPINTRTSLQGLDVSNGKPNTVLQSYPDGSTIRYSRFGADKYLPAVLTDRNGNVITYERDPSGRLLEARDVHNRFISFTYNAAGRIASTTDNAGRTTSYIYDASGNRISDTDVNGDVTQYEYGGYGNHQITQITHPNGGKTFKTYRFDSPYFGRIATVSDDGGANLTTYGYTNGDTKATDTDALNHVTSYDFIQNSGMKRLSKVTDALDGVTSLTYDADMRATIMTDPLGRTISFRYDAGGNQVATVDPLGQVTQATYFSKYNAVSSMIDPKGNKTSFFYDAKGNLIQVKDAAGSFTTISYDKQGHPVAIKDALGNMTAAAYNGSGAATSVSDSLGRTVNMTRDALNRVTQYTDPAGKQTSLTYDADGNTTLVKDALNGITAFDYQAGRGRRQLRTVTDAKSHTTTLNYDLNARLTSSVNALNQSASIGYDAKSRATSVTTRNGQTMNFTYDSLDRLTQLSVPEGNVGMTYDAAGRLLTASNYNGSALAMTYDVVDRVTQVIQTLPNGHSVTIGSAFDTNGNRTARTAPWGSVSHLYDALDRLRSVADSQGGIVTYTYDALGRLTAMGYPNGIKTTYAYDAAGQVLQVLHKKTADQTAIAFMNYDYDLSGNRTQITDATGVHTFAYDQLNRLTAANHPGGSSLSVLSEIFSMDAVGNRTADAVRTNYQHDAANRIVSDSSVTYTSDANGNRISQSSRVSGQTVTMAYDSNSRLVAVEGPTGTLGAYKYDPASRRVERTAEGATYRYVHDGMRIVAILDDSNNLQTSFTYGLGMAPIGMHKNGQDYFLHADALGSVVAISDISGNIIETYEYQAYGKAVVKDVQGGLHDRSTVGNPFMYAGAEYDLETGLYHMGFRYYDPETGRFLQEDPIGFGGEDMSFYVYAGNSPVNRLDPFGLAPTGEGMDAHLGTQYKIPIPPNANIDAEIAHTRFLLGYGPGFAIIQYVRLVKTGGDWDWKRHGPQYRKYGDFSFGATAAALGFSEEQTLRGAGAYQFFMSPGLPSSISLSSLMRFGTPLRAPYGDDPVYVPYIKAGHRYYREKYKDDPDCPK